MNFRTLLTIIFLFCTQFLSGQNRFAYDIDSLENELKQAPNSLSKLPILERLVIFYFQSDEDDRIYEHLKEMETIAIMHEHHLGVSLVYNQYGNIYFARKRDFEKAMYYQMKAINYAQQKKVDNDGLYSYLFSQAGLIYKNMDQYDSAIFYYQKSMEKSMATGDATDIVRITLNLSRLYSKNGNYYESIKMAKQLLQFGLKNNDKETICSGYRRLGEVYGEIGALASAKDYLDRSLALSIEIYGKNDSNTFYTYNLLGEAYTDQGELEKGLSFYHKYLSYLRNRYGDRHPTQVYLYRSMGISLNKLSRYDSAEYYFDLGLQSLDPSQKGLDVAYYTLLTAKAGLFLDAGKKDQFLAVAQQALNYELKDKRRRGIIYKLLGDYYFSIDHLDKGIEAYQKSIQAIIPEFENNDINNNPSIKQINDNIYVLQVLLAKGGGFEKLASKNDQTKSALLHQAKNTYLLCDTLVSKLESSYKSDDDAISFFNSWKQVYAHGIHVSKQLYEMGDDPKYMDLAFHFAERSKATVLSRVSSQRNILSNFGVEDSIRSYQERLKSNITHYQTKLSTARLKADTLQVRKHSNRLFTLQNEQAVLNDSLRLNYPDYYELLNKSDNTLSRSEIAARLGKRVLIEYTVGEDSIYAFVMDRQRTRLISLKKGDDLDYLIDEHSASILKKQTQEFSQNAHLLYNRLMEPLLRDVEPDRELLIIPDAQLWRVNFDLLLTEENTSKDFGVLPYLIKRYPISYANSASFLFNQVKPINAKRLDQCLAFSYSEEEQMAESSKIDFTALRDAKGDLPGTREEIRSISNILSGAYYYGEEANEANFKSNVGKYGVLHLAVHGELSDHDPLYSNLKFSPSQTDSLEDDLLYTYEIYDMHVNANLAVLSACNTAQGELKGGEGVMSLGRAFQYAGVQSLLVSNWEVADKQAPRLMQYFYEGLINDGYSKSVALQKAKLKYLETAGVFEKAPFYWGNFMVLGDPSPINSKADHSVWLGFLAVLLIFGIMFWVLEIRRKAAC